MKINYKKWLFNDKNKNSEGMLRPKRLKWRGSPFKMTGVKMTCRQPKYYCWQPSSQHKQVKKVSLTAKRLRWEN